MVLCAKRDLELLPLLAVYIFICLLDHVVCLWLVLVDFPTLTVPFCELYKQVFPWTVANVVNVNAT